MATVDASPESDTTKVAVTNDVQKKMTLTLDRFQDYVSVQMNSETGNNSLRQCSTQLQQLRQQQKDAAGDQAKLHQWMQMFAKLLMDATYIEECQLVEEEFPEPDGDQKLHKLIEYLGEPEQLVQKCFENDTEVSHVLGVEITECLHWRRGALFYMYCSITMDKTQDHILQKRNHLLQCIYQGVRFLQAMLRVRAPIELAKSDITCNSEDTYQLLQAGLFSDTHVLALMYGGELCSWFLQLKRDGDGDADLLSNFNAADTGRALLTAYVRAAMGPLKLHGWDTTKAQELLEKLKS